MRPLFRSVNKEIKQKAVCRTTIILKFLYKLFKKARAEQPLLPFLVLWEERLERSTLQALRDNQTRITSCYTKAEKLFLAFEFNNRDNTSNHLGLEMAKINLNKTRIA